MEITGPTSEYTAALLDSNDPLNGLIKLLSAFDVKFKGSNFTYTPQDVSIVIGALPLASALAIEPVATPRGFEIKGYPWSLKINDAAMATTIPDTVAGWFPFANETAEDETVTRNTFAQSVAQMANYTTATAMADDDTTCIANLGQKFSNLTSAVLLNAITGIDVITLDDFKTFETANTP